MKKINRRKINIRKVSGFAIWSNAIQILAMLAILLYALTRNYAFLSRSAEIGLLSVCLVIVVTGAVMDIREAFLARSIAEHTQMLEDAYAQLEALNHTLRKQRHDTRNHLQVILSLTEMNEYDALKDYIERIYADLIQVGGASRTDIPAINALLAAKQVDCSERGIRFECIVESPWSELGENAWALCRVLGNLIDNARDAILTLAKPEGHIIRVRFAESKEFFHFEVVNDGPAIPTDALDRIFTMGYTTKSHGHGSGLAIVRETMQALGGTIAVSSNNSQTVFSGDIPRTNAF